MVKLQWTPQAVEDLQAIFDYISKDSRPIARIFVEKIYHHVDQLIDYPRVAELFLKLKILISGN